MDDNQGRILVVVNLRGFTLVNLCCLCKNNVVRELESFFFFFTLFTWTVVFVAPLEVSFHNFFVLFSPPTYVFSLIYFMFT
jgi:hypothetical protein